MWWPRADPPIDPAGVVVVTVNYNTKRLVTILLWSLYRFLGPELRSVVAVDNGSSDGSAQVLEACARVGLCELIRNPTNRYHGPAVTQALAYRASRFDGGKGSHPWLWLLDSDCVVARRDAATAAISAARAARVALLGEASWNRWHQDIRLCGYSLLIDPARAWRLEIGPLGEGGDPVGDFEQSCRRFGVPIATFPFTAGGFVVHLGRGTLAGVYERGETSNAFFDWAADHHEPHFQEVQEAPMRYAALLEEFDAVVGDMQPERVVAACLRAARMNSVRTSLPSTGPERTDRV
jgi:glycosyltransferase involved in cell wall biosynthesis